MERRLWACALLAGASLAGAVTREAAAAEKPAAKQATFTQTMIGRDLSGIWKLDQYVGSGRPVDEKILRTSTGEVIPLQPWAQAIYSKNLDLERNGTAYAGNQASCLPHGMPQMMLALPAAIQILQTPGQITFFHELGRQVRIVHMDRPHDPDPDPSYFGDDIGHWEGDTLVVDTIGLTEKTTIDMMGAPHSPELHIVEHIRLLNPNKLEDRITLEDPKAFTHKFDLVRTYTRQPKGTEVLEYICADGNQNWPDANGVAQFPGVKISK